MSSSNVRGRKGGERKRASRGAPEADPPAEAAPPEPIAYSAVRGWLSLSVAAVAVWWVALIGMAVVSANPVTLNHAQLTQSTHVVTGTVLDLGTGRVRVDRTWTLRTPDEITVENLADTDVVEGRSYVLPLVARDGGSRFAVRTARLPGFDLDDRGAKVDRYGPPLVYPATDEALDQLQAFFPPPTTED